MKRILVFLVSVLILTWVPAFWLYTSGMYKNALVTQLMFMLFMLMPALSVILTRVITKEGFKNLMLHPHFKGNILTYLLAWFGPSFLTILGAALYFLVFPNQFDAAMTTLSKQLTLQLEQAGASGVTGLTPQMIMYIQIATAIFAGPLLNLIAALGEELGWRGYLLPKLTEKYSIRSSILISGVIWGIWHAPMIMMGHNYGINYPTYPWGGILAMIAFCVFVGSFFSWLALRSDSAIPPALAHGGLNSLASVSAYFIVPGTAYSLFVGPMPVGFIGGFGYIIVGVICFLVSKKKHYGDIVPDAAYKEIS